MLAAPSSGSGKTMITCGFLQALINRGLSPVSFKCGPDYIDPMFHTKVIGAKSRNLDTFFTGRDVTRYLFARTASKADISVLEGVMGIYDGLGGISPRASSYELAQVTNTPVILVVNARGMSLSVIPLIRGYLDYQSAFGSQMIRGVILNQTSRMTYLLLKEKIEQDTGVRLLGYVPRLPDCVIESRHLGLVTPDEITDVKNTLDRLGKELEQCLDINGILELAQEASDYEETELRTPECAAAYITGQQEHGGSGCMRSRLGVAMDEAFCFYYQDNLELLEAMGAELIPFSPLHDTHLPQGISGLIFGGGYPELYTRQLAHNVPMREEIYRTLKGGMPYLAECGGFMYLHEEMEDMEGRGFPMCGVIPGRSFHTSKLSRFGYIQLQVNEEAGIQMEQLLKPGHTIRGHEFHYFDSTNAGAAYRAQKPLGKRQWECIHGDTAYAAGYPHLYYWSEPAFAAAFVEKTVQYRQSGLRYI